jgi:hypothetical protein
MSTPRKTRSDKKVGTIEKELGISIYGPDGRKIRKDKTLGDVRKIQTASLSKDQQIAARIQVKTHPKAKASDLKKIQKAVNAITRR